MPSNSNDLGHIVLGLSANFTLLVTPNLYKVHILWAKFLYMNDININDLCDLDPVTTEEGHYVSQNESVDSIMMTGLVMLSLI